MVIRTMLALLVSVLMVAGMENGGAEAELFSTKLMHKFSGEVTAVRVLRSGGNGSPQKWSSDYYRRLLSSDLQRQKMKLGPQFEYLFPSQGSTALPLGNDFGWLHYTWIDIGTPSVSFLVALDTGSDLLWVPCDCMQCAPLSASYYSNLDKDLNEYNPSGSNTSKVIPCNHQLCELGSSCESPKEPCPYTVNYDTEDTSTSGLLVEDILHLASGSTTESKKFVRAPIMIGSQGLPKTPSLSLKFAANNSCGLQSCICHLWQPGCSWFLFSHTTDRQRYWYNWTELHDWVLDGI